MTRRWGLVLGCGGFLGAAWMPGALAAIQGRHGWDPRDAALMIGTSAGSVMSALLRSGQAVDELYAAHAEETATAWATDLPVAGPLPVCRTLPTTSTARRTGRGSPPSAGDRCRYCSRPGELR